MQSVTPVPGTEIPAAKPNPGRKRFLEFDILRAVSMMLMVVAHTWEQLGRFGDPYIWGSYNLFSYSYAFIGPSVLMICLGTNLAFSSQKPPKVLVKRGILFLGIDLMLNVVRFGIPSVALLFLGRPEFLDYFTRNLLCSDIYAFVGALFILFALFQKLKLSPGDILLVAIGMLTVNTALGFTSLNSIENEMLGYFLGRFVYVNWSSYFSLLPWFIFPAIGYYFGTMLKQMPEEQQSVFAGKLLKISLVCLVAMCVALSRYGISHSIANIVYSNYQTDLLSIFLMVVLAGIPFAIAHWIVKKYPTSRFVSVSCKISKVIMPFYVIQWIIIGWMEGIMEAFGCGEVFHKPWEIYAISIVVALFSLFLAFAFAARKAKAKRVK